MREELEGHWVCGEYYSADAPWDRPCTRKLGHKGKHRFTVKWRSPEPVHYEPHEENCGCVGCLIKKIWSPVLDAQLDQRVVDFWVRRAD